jgi:hypothetical protein
MAFVYSLICAEVHRTLRITYFGFGATEIRALLVTGNLLTLWAGVLDVGQSFALRGWLGPVTIHELVIVSIFAITVPSLAMMAVRERRDLARVDPPAAAASRVREGGRALGIVAPDPQT